MAAMARDPQLPTHWFNILHDRPQYVTSAVSRSRLGGEVKTAGHGALLQQPLSLARQSINTTDRFIPIPSGSCLSVLRPTSVRSLGLSWTTAPKSRIISPRMGF